MEDLALFFYSFLFNSDNFYNEVSDYIESKYITKNPLQISVLIEEFSIANIHLYYF